MTLIKSILTIAFGLGLYQSTDLCKGIVEENNLWIAATEKNMNGISEQDFNDVIDHAIDLYEPVIEAEGANLIVERKWSDGTVNAYARRSGGNWIVSMFGGLARHETITKDGFALVICHELGHHIGGAPKYSGFFNNWASNEGQSDYFAGLKCLRRFFAKEDNVAYMDQFEIPVDVEDQCASEQISSEEQAICQRIAMAGQSVAYLFQALRNESAAPRFDTPDTSAVSKTLDSHPATQCRMDTYFQGGVCSVSVDEDVDQSEYRTGSCVRESHDLGLRPTCWFKPESI